VLAQGDRIALLDRLLDPNTAPIEHRAARILLLLLGRPYTRISAMTIDDISSTDHEVTVRLPGGNVPLPHPFGTVFTELVTNRPNMNTATQHASRWLFAGRRADQPMTSNTLRRGGINMGIDLAPAKRSALRQPVPAPHRPSWPKCSATATKPSTDTPKKLLPLPPLRRQPLTSCRPYRLGLSAPGRPRSGPIVPIIYWLQRHLNGTLWPRLLHRSREHR
jgi:hypothetical protein